MMWWMCYSEKLNFVFFLEGPIDTAVDQHILIDGGVLVIEAETYFPLHSNAAESPEGAAAIVSLMAGNSGPLQ